MKRFLEQIQKEKVRPRYILLTGTQPNIDFFTREELKQTIRKFKTDIAEGNLEAVSISIYNNFTVHPRTKRSWVQYRPHVRRSYEQSALVIIYEAAANQNCWRNNTFKTLRGCLRNCRNKSIHHVPIGRICQSLVSNGHYWDVSTQMVGQKIGQWFRYPQRLSFACIPSIYYTSTSIND